MSKRKGMKRVEGRAVREADCWIKQPENYFIIATLVAILANYKELAIGSHGDGY